MLEEQAKLLITITKGIVSAEVIELGEMSKLHEASGSPDFAYRFNLVGKFINDYKFQVMIFWHDITFYPAGVKFDGQLAKELQIDQTKNRASVSNALEAEVLVTRVLGSERVRSVVGSILRLSK